MAQSATAAAGSRVNRRFLFLALILAALAAVLVYAAISRSSGEGSSTGSTPVVVARSAIPPGTRITSDLVEVKDYAASNAPPDSLAATDVVIGQVARFPISQGEPVLLSKIVSTSATTNDALSYILESGKRGMAVTVEQVVSAGGLVLPGDYVDVFAVPDELKGADHPGAFLLAENVEVVAVEQILAELPASAPGLVDDQGSPSDGQRVAGTVGEPQPEAITVTFMLTPAQVSNVFCGDEAGQLRLALRAFGDTSPTGLPIEICVLDADEQ